VVVMQLASGLSVHAFANGRLVRIGTLKKVEVPFVGTRDGKGLFGWPQHPFEVVVSDEALEAAVKKSRRKKKAKKAKAKAKLEVEAARVEAPSEAIQQAVALEPLPVERANAGSLAKERDGHILLALKAGKYRRTLSLTDPSGEEHDLTDAIGDDLEDNILGLSLAPDGTHAFIRTEGRVLCVDAAGEALEVVLEAEPLADVEAVSAERVWIADGSSVQVVERRESGEWVSLGKAKRAKASYLLAVHGDLAVVLTMDPLTRKAPKNATRIFSCEGGKVREVAKVDLESYRAAVVDGAWYTLDATRRIYELRGLPAD
jgi:hypothetical protein